MQIVIDIDRRFVARLLAGSALALAAAALVIPAIVWAFELPAASDPVDLNPPKKPGGKPPKLKPVLQTVETVLDNYAKNLTALEAAIRSLEESQARTLSPEEEEILSHMSLVELDDGKGKKTKTIRISSVNVQIVNGLGATNGNPAQPDDTGASTATNGLGNLIVGYQEPRGAGDDNDRTGSHNIIVGAQNNYTKFGGLVAGQGNRCTGPFSSVSGGRFNTASAIGSSVSGGRGNTASHFDASVSGGSDNTASGELSSVSGGNSNRASQIYSSISGGKNNFSISSSSSVSGGINNTASAPFSSVSGGRNNNANGDSSSVSGGFNRSVDGDNDWQGGGLKQDE